MSSLHSPYRHQDLHSSALLSLAFPNATKSFRNSDIDCPLLPLLIHPDHSGFPQGSEKGISPLNSGVERDHWQPFGSLLVSLLVSSPIGYELPTSLEDPGRSISIDPGPCSLGHSILPGWLGETIAFQSPTLKVSSCLCRQSYLHNTAVQVPHPLTCLFSEPHVCGEWWRDVMTCTPPYDSQVRLPPLLVATSCQIRSPCMSAACSSF